MNCPRCGSVLHGAQCRFCIERESLAQRGELWILTNIEMWAVVLGGLVAGYLLGRFLP